MKILSAIRQALMESFKGFMLHTSMHGCQYICQDDRKFFERILWASIIALSLSSGVYVIKEVYRRQIVNPTQTFIKDMYYPLANIAFPAVTICNHNRIIRSKAMQLADSLKLPEGLSKNDLLSGIEFLADLSEPEEVNFDLLNRTQKILELNGLVAADLLFNLSQPCSNMLEKCQWQGKVQECSTIFHSSLSYLGYCCSFNYPIENSVRAIHSSLFGLSMGLNVVVNPQFEEYFSSAFISSGVLVLIHDPQIYPDSTVSRRTLPVGKEAFIALNPTAHITDDGVRDLVTSFRRCFFEDEGHLAFFHKYEDRNCVIECKMNYSHKLCGCIPYVYSKISNLTICGLKDSVCRHNHMYTFQTQKTGLIEEKEIIIDDYVDEKSNIDDSEEAMDCDCLSSCNFNEYDSSVSYGEFLPVDGSINVFPGADVNFTGRILLHVYTESNFIQLLSTEVVISISGLLSYLGGTTCIFLGCSFLTVIEILQFFIIRFAEYMRKLTKAQNATSK